ncbi:hypothetical protein CDAR_76561 [Caerostris darwini]|uniref:Uncharacterized protein n=1 Tax=Caerostris darwini TaxID=1538125 RepID=A0AAV4QEQ4_9ARAC|nr:hypothetical protein CDAR_76561 [Caerostris darwini]
MKDAVLSKAMDLSQKETQNQQQQGYFGDGLTFNATEQQLFIEKLPPTPDQPLTKDCTFHLGGDDHRCSKRMAYVIARYLENR